MEHWASAVLETISEHPNTPPPSPARTPQATAAAHPFDDHSLPSFHARTVDIELGLVVPSVSHGGETEIPVGALVDHSAASRAHSTPTPASCSATAKEPVSRETEMASVAQPARSRLYAALLAGIFQQCLSNGLIMTYGTILSYYTTHLLRQASSTKLNLIGAVPAFVCPTPRNLSLASYSYSLLGMKPLLTFS